MNFGLAGKKSAVIVIAVCMAAIAIAAILTNSYPQSTKKNGETAAASNLEKIKQEHFKNEETEEANKQKPQSAADEEKMQNKETAEVSTNPVATIEDEQGLYIASAEKFEAAEYAEAVAGFEKIALSGKQERFVSESIFFAAQSYERLKDFDKAIKYYSMYVEFFSSGHYSDDSLYSLGLAYYAQGDKEKSQSTLKRLMREYPDSMFINSKVKNIILQD